MDFCQSLERAFITNANSENALTMSNYMKGRFSFFGIKTQARRQLFKNIGNTYDMELDAREAALFLYSRSQRELHYCGIEILIKKIKANFLIEDIQLIETLITTHSWWDSVDVIAKYLLGAYLQKYPSEKLNTIERFANSENMWLIRSAILFQLGYKQKTDFELLKALCLQHKSSKEFFIQKAIGWALREYGKTNPLAVHEFVTIAQLQNLSQKEALKNIC